MALGKSFTVKIASVNTLDCKIFFETQGLGIDFGAPICGSGSTCVPNACFERQTLSGVFGSDLTSARGVEQWDFEATVTETLEGAAQVFRYRCKGDANFTATKQEPDEEATDGTSRPRAPGRTKGQE